MDLGTRDIYLRVALSRHTEKFCCRSAVKHRLCTIIRSLHQEPHERCKGETDKSVLSERHVTMDVASHHTRIGCVYCHSSACTKQMQLARCMARKNLRFLEISLFSFKLFLRFYVLPNGAEDANFYIYPFRILYNTKRERSAVNYSGHKNTT